jgi:hypothetical protein
MSGLCLRMCDIGYVMAAVTEACAFPIVSVYCPCLGTHNDMRVTDG